MPSGLWATAQGLPQLGHAASVPPVSPGPVGQAIRVGHGIPFPSEIDRARRVALRGECGAPLSFRDPHGLTIDSPGAVGAAGLGVPWSVAVRPGQPSSPAALGALGPWGAMDGLGWQRGECASSCALAPPVLVVQSGGPAQGPSYVAPIPPGQGAAFSWVPSLYQVPAPWPLGAPQTGWSQPLVSASAGGYPLRAGWLGSSTQTPFPAGESSTRPMRQVAGGPFVSGGWV